MLINSFLARWGNDLTECMQIIIWNMYMYINCVWHHICIIMFECDMTYRHRLFYGSDNHRHRHHHHHRSITSDNIIIINIVIIRKIAIAVRNIYIHKHSISCGDDCKLRHLWIPCRWHLSRNLRQKSGYMSDIWMIWSLGETASWFSSTSKHIS